MDLKEFEIDGRMIDFVNLEIRAGEHTYPLTLMEANLLRYLLRHNGQAVSRKAMLEEVWEYAKIPTRVLSTISSSVAALSGRRSRESEAPPHVRGVGYRFVATP